MAARAFSFSTTKTKKEPHMCLLVQYSLDSSLSTSLLAIHLSILGILL